MSVGELQGGVQRCSGSGQSSASGEVTGCGWTPRQGRYGLGRRYCRIQVLVQHVGVGENGIVF